MSFLPSGTKLSGLRVATRLTLIPAIRRSMTCGYESRVPPGNKRHIVLH
ncbi:MAG: hypothetical protein LBF69_02875 [Prevotellaceae bacterium]|nr:hypothetical protein [Prevotellaceae bacterium]